MAFFIFGTGFDNDVQVGARTRPNHVSSAESILLPTMSKQLSNLDVRARQHLLRNIFLDLATCIQPRSR